MNSTALSSSAAGRLPDVIDIAAGVKAGSPLATLREMRPELRAYMQASCEAVTQPSEPGGLPTDLRVALACRIATQNAQTALAAYYRQMLEAQLDSDLVASIADGAEPPAALARISALVRHADLLSTHPKDAGRADIEALTTAGIGDADIVRLSELVALVSFQVRVIAGLRVLGTDR